MIYGSYVPRGTSIASTSVAIALADTGVALLAGMAIFPIVFANGMEPGSGPGLIFQTLPVAFGNMTGGIAFGSLFFILLLVAAWTSSISLIEPTGHLDDRTTYDMSRITASLWSGLATWLLGLGTVFSFNIWEKVENLWSELLRASRLPHLKHYAPTRRHSHRCLRRLVDES